MACKDHPDAPHGFLRNASLTQDRYVCECEYWDEAATIHSDKGYEVGTLEDCESFQRKRNMNTHWTIALEEADDGSGDMVLPLGNEICDQLGWKTGDTVEWIDNHDGSWILRKKEMEKELVLVECISTFRQRYVVEVPAGKKEWALDTVTMNEATEFSQEHLGETIVSHRVISEAEFVQLHNEDNDYLKDWTDEQKKRHITQINDDGELADFVAQDSDAEKEDIKHSKDYFDTDRNK